MDGSSGSHQLSVVYNTVSDGTKQQLGLISVPQFQSNGQRVDINVVYMDQRGSIPNSIKSEYYSSNTGTEKLNVLDPLVNLTRSTGQKPEMIPNNAFHSDFSTLNDSGPEMTESNDGNQMKSTSLGTPKPSEALFVRALIGRCKRIAPLWFRGVSSMRERNREENRRMASNSGQSQSDWSLIGLKIAEMNAASETDAVANLLKKLYKELPTDSVFWFLKCWLGSEDSLNDPDSCVISRGDAKGRMRRIDGGKGSDKVWRLDTIVGMLYHGLPMSSTDTNIMVHTCDQELCVRPQHIRFRASSVALVVVLKALAQAGYTVIPPPVAAGPNGVAPNASDESVDVFGPFTIDELQKYRSENLTPAEDSISKLTLSASDRDFADTVPVIRASLQGIRCDTQSVVPPASSSQPLISHMNGYHPPGSRVKVEPTDLAYHRQHQPSNTVHPNLGPLIPDSHSPQMGIPVVTDITTCSPNSSQIGRALVASIGSTVSNSTTATTSVLKHPLSSLDEFNVDTVPNSPSSVCLPVASCAVSGHRLERRSLKRPAPSDSPCSFPSSPVRLSQHNHHHQHQLVPPPHPVPSSSPPLLISDMANSISLSQHHHPHHHHPHHHHRHLSMPHQHRQLSSDSTLLPCFAQTTSEPGPLSRCNPLNTTSSDPNTSFPVNHASEHPRLSQDAGTAVSHSNMSGPPSVMMLHQPLALPMNHHPLAQHNAPSSGPSSGFTTSANAIPSSAAGFAVVTTAAAAAASGGGSSSSGKTTPRQPAKKRLEARTPTIEGSLLDESGTGSGGGGGGGPRSTPLLGTGSDDSNPAIASSGSGGVIAFRVHQNTPFVPVQSRSGRPSSGGSASSGSFIPATTMTSETGTSGSLLAAVQNRNMPDADEMDQELVDIMVRRSGSTASGCPADGAGSGPETSSCALTSEGTAGRRTLGYSSGLSIHPELGTSPTRRRIIEALVASWTASHGSPMPGSSTPLNPRRSASACSLPRVGASPNDDLTEFLTSPSGHPAGSSWYPLQNNAGNHGQKSLWFRDEPSHAMTMMMMTGRKSAGPPQRSHATPPPNTTGGDFRLSSGTRALGQSTLHTPTLNGDGFSALDSSSVQELESLIRNSPTSGELIDMLVNMAQQYGVQQPRAGSSASRPSSQVAQRFYRSLVNGSVCGSPFLVAGLSGSGTSTSNTITSTQTQSGAFGTNSAMTTGTCGSNSQLISPTSTTAAAAASGQHHLRGLSFTPLAVDSELGYSSAHAMTVSSPGKHSCVMEPAASTATGDLQSSTNTTTTTGSGSCTGNSIGNGFSYRRPLKQ